MEENQQQVVQIASPSLTYMPNSSEKKRAIMMYVFFGIMIGVTKKEMNPFEHFHLRQSIGRRMIFLVLLIVTLAVMFLPLIKYLALIPMMIMLIAWILFVKQSWSGKYIQAVTQSPLYLFAGLGGRVLNLFDIEVKIPYIGDMGEKSPVSQIPPPPAPVPPAPVPPAS